MPEHTGDISHLNHYSIESDPQPWVSKSSVSGLRCPLWARLNLPTNLGNAVRVLCATVPVSVGGATAAITEDVIELKTI